jgi:uncharacterized membrane protein
VNHEIFAAIGEALTKGEEVALITIVASNGSTPQRVGAKMLVFADGRTVGTIGGGCYEQDACGKARLALQTGRPTLAQYDLNADIHGTLDTVTFSQFMNGAMTCLIGNEIVFARVASLISANTYTLSGLLRGRFGTEQHIGTHAAGERFVRLSTAGTIRPPLEQSDIGVGYFYRAVSIGRRFDSVASDVIASAAVGLRPLSGVNVRGGRQHNDHYHVSWDRRTRVDGGWRSGVDVPLAEAIALSFIAPLIALYLAAVMLGEKIGRGAVIASLLGFIGVLVIGAGRLGREALSEDAMWGIGAVLLSAVLYAFNLIFQRKQAQLASPQEVALFQMGFAGLFLLLAAPWLAVVPSLPALGEIAAGAALAAVSLMLLSWAYARAEAQALLPIEYTAFIWAALLGWLVFAEPVTVETMAGVVLIVIGCWIASRQAAPAHTEQTTL